ncbi:MAG: 3,4-dihydroxy-2-butanone-4-phosphate synthase, partial [Coxiellaceae bacterium]|nr:3,4-dihydroxy-2-butanone-4-phosphate synthase [Coxiellaceae bacterium]
MVDIDKRIESAVAALRQGQMVILLDDDTRENEGDFVLAAEFANAVSINFMLQHGGGLVCMPITKQRARYLQLDMQPLRNDDPLQQAPFTVTIDAASGNTTGISAADRARTIKTAVADDATPYDLVTPGHVFPLRAA